MKFLDMFDFIDYKILNVKILVKFLQDFGQVFVSMDEIFEILWFENLKLMF